MPLEHACPMCVALEAENDRLREEIRQLRSYAAAEAGWRAPLEWRLTTAEVNVVKTLLDHAIASKEALMIATERDVTGESDRDMKIVDVFVCKVRAKLRSFGWAIETLWGRGYAMPPAQREAMLAGAVVWTAS